MDVNEERQKYQDKLEVLKLKQLTTLLESIPAFARASDENEWTTLLPSSAEGVYTESELDRMQMQVDKLYYTNPSARGIIDTMVNFIVGKDLTIVPLDADPAVADYWNTFYEVNGMDLRIREFVKRTLLKGESFMRFYAPLPFKSVDLSKPVYYNDIPMRYPVPFIRFVEPSEIADAEGIISYGIETSPKDVEEVISYRRKFTHNNVPSSETIPAAEIIHTKVMVDSNMKRGVSFLVGIAEYMIKYHDWLEDRIAINKLRTMFNLIMKVTGAGSPQALKDKFEDATVPTGTTLSGDVPKTLPKRGGVLLSTSNIEYEFLNPDIRAADTAVDGRAIDLMLAKGTSLTEYVIRGDASNANYASSMVAESPMVRMFQAQQDFFEKPLQQLFRKVIRYGIEKDHIPATTEKVQVIIDQATQDETIKKETSFTDHRCKITFETLIHRDILKEAQALNIHWQNGWDSSVGIIAKIGNDANAVQRDLRLEGKRRDEQEQKDSEARYTKAMTPPNTNKEDE